MKKRKRKNLSAGKRRQRKRQGKRRDGGFGRFRQTKDEDKERDKERHRKRQRDTHLATSSIKEQASLSVTEGLGVSGASSIAGSIGTPLSGIAANEAKREREN